MPEGSIPTETRTLPTAPENGIARQTEQSAGKMSQIKEKLAANRNYRKLMKPIDRENYTWTGFARKNYDPEAFARKEHEAYAKAYGEAALQARNAATPQPKKTEQKHEQHTDATHTDQTKPQEVTEIRRVMKDHSDEQLQDRIALGGLGAEVAKKILEERQRQQTRDKTPRITNGKDHSSAGEYTQRTDDENSEIPTDKNGLILFARKHFDSLEQLPEDKIKEAFTPQIIDLYRRYLQHKVKMLIDTKRMGTYQDTVLSVLGNNAVFLQKLIYAQTDQMIDDVTLLSQPFSKLAAIMNIELPDDFAKHFRNTTAGPDTEREAA